MYIITMLMLIYVMSLTYVSAYVYSFSITEVSGNKVSDLFWGIGASGIAFPYLMGILDFSQGCVGTTKGEISNPIR